LHPQRLAAPPASLAWTEIYLAPTRQMKRSAQQGPMLTLKEFEDRLTWHAFRKKLLMRWQKTLPQPIEDIVPRMQQFTKSGLP
jgi:hypothetical protein